MSSCTSPATWATVPTSVPSALTTSQPCSICNHETGSVTTDRLPTETGRLEQASPATLAPTSAGRRHCATFAAAGAAPAPSPRTRCLHRRGCSRTPKDYVRRRPSLVDHACEQLQMKGLEPDPGLDHP